MMLTPIDPAVLPAMLARFRRGLEDPARRAFDRIAVTLRLAPNLTADLHLGRHKAIYLARQFDIATIDEEPAAAFSWDGHAIRTRSETSVVFHEVAHWQIALAARRALPDFGLGAGPETGRIADANAAACVDAATKESEENLASLL
ncbi:MAG: elongation factor P hydroxylase, partial [Alphaproteobacteria bacterium]|nr:elongation factor P hydroxylase [Alphaproteobacteria bacterium]